jgi:DNA uptake protein ComE-like DNA-binding protein
MTLPSVNREIAKSIVEHRKAIGRFRKVEDLALVRGIGADKLEKLRPEICVTTRRNLSCASSRAQSFDSLRSADSRLTVKSNRLVNVNKANVFELQCVHGITQEIAAAIVHYRDKKGPFKQVGHLRVDFPPRCLHGH